MNEYAMDYQSLACLLYYTETDGLFGNTVYFLV